MFDEPLFRIGSRAITPLTLLEPLVILTVAALALAGSGLLFRRLKARASPERAPLIYVLSQVFRYAIIIGGGFAVISTLGLDLSSISIFAGALGVGVGLGLQDVVRNFVSGIILLFDQSIEVGDFIELTDGAAGMVVGIGPRATTITTNDNVDILIPNAQLLSAELTNWTRNHASRRVHVPFGVAYGSDKDKVREAALEAARSVPFTDENDSDRRTQVWLTGFGDSALEFELVVWPTLEAVKRPGSMYAAYRWALDDALARHGLEIPFPQRDIRVRSLFGTEGADALAHVGRPDLARRDSRGSARQRPATPASGNDAAADIVESAARRPDQDGG